MSYSLLGRPSKCVIPGQLLMHSQQLCVNNMATIAQSEFQCAQGDTSCFCTKSNWAYGVRDCSRQACGEAESAQAVAWAAGQCIGMFSLPLSSLGHLTYKQ
jgi:hypothetical protein